MVTDTIENRRARLESSEPLNNTYPELLKYYKNTCADWYAIFEETREQCEASFGALYLFDKMDTLMGKMMELNDPLLVNCHGELFVELVVRINHEMLVPNHADTDEEHSSFHDLYTSLAYWEDWCKIYKEYHNM